MEEVNGEPRHFSKYRDKAKRILQDEEKVKSLIDVATNKAGQILNSSAKMEEFARHLRLVLRMLKAYIKGEYRVIPWKTLVVLVGAIIYFVSPFDFVPDFLPVFGFMDDISIIMWLIRSFSEDIDNFRSWESEIVLD